MEEVFLFAGEIQKEIEAREEIEEVHSNYPEMIDAILYLPNQPGNGTVS